MSFQGCVRRKLPSRIFADPRLWREVAALHQAIMTGAECLDIEQRVLHVFGRLLEQCRLPIPAASAQTENSPRLQRMVDFLHARHQDRVTLDGLASIGQCSKMHVLRLFKVGVGMTPHGYLTQVRLEQARRMIAAGLPLADAALSAGFADQSHLTRNFRRRYGLTRRLPQATPSNLTAAPNLCAGCCFCARNARSLAVCSLVFLPSIVRESPMQHYLRAVGAILCWASLPAATGSGLDVLSTEELLFYSFHQRRPVPLRCRRRSTRSMRLALPNLKTLAFRGVIFFYHYVYYQAMARAAGRGGDSRHHLVFLDCGVFVPACL